MSYFDMFVSHLMNGKTEELRRTLRLEFVNKLIDDKGHFPIHIACEKGFLNIVILLLNENCNIECEDIWGYKPIHYATLNGNIEIVKLLLQHKCRIDCRTKGWFGLTPFDIAKKWSRTDCIELFHTENLIAAIKKNDPIEFEKLCKSYDFMSQKLHTGLTILQTAADSNADKIIKCILDRPVENKEINDLMKEITEENDKLSNLTKECILYRSIIHQHAAGFKKFINAAVINGPHKIATQSFLEIAAEQGHELFIDGIMKKTIYNKSIWVRAIKKAKDKKFKEIQEEITERMNLFESRIKVNFTILHSAICDNDTDMVKYILDHPNNIDLDSNNETLGTALALAHSLHHRKCIKVLQQYELATNTQNKYSQTPLHEAIASGLDDNCGYLINRSINIDQIGFLGLTGLHCAVIKGMENVCEQMVNNGANYMKFVEFTCQSSENEITIPFEKSIIALSLMENALTLSIKFHGKLFLCFLDKLNSTTSNARDGNNNSLLHMAVKCLQPELCKSLLDSGAKVDVVNSNGNSPLFEMFCNSNSRMTEEKVNRMIEITNILIGYGADINVKSTNRITIFQSASKLENERIMLALLSNNPIFKNFSSKDFQMAFDNHWFQYAECLLKLLSDSFLESNITNEAFVQCKTEPNLIKLLFSKSSSSFQRAIIETLLWNAIRKNDKKLFDFFIKIEISSPKLFSNGENLFTQILKVRKIHFAWKVLESKNKMKFVNLKNKTNQTPLQVAIEIDEMDLVDALIHESNEFDCEDINGNSVLTQLIGKISICKNVNSKSRLMAAMKSAILLGGDIYKVSSCGKRIIDTCTDCNAKSEIERFHGNNLKKKEYVNDKICIICMNNTVDVAFQCGHLVCSVCGNRLFVCPVCNKEISNKTKIYFS